MLNILNLYSPVGWIYLKKLRGGEEKFSLYHCFSTIWLGCILVLFLCLFFLRFVEILKIWYLYILLLSSFSHIWLFATLQTAACQASLSFTISWSLLKLKSIVSMMPSNPLTLCRPILLLPSIFPNSSLHIPSDLIMISCISHIADHDSLMGSQTAFARQEMD